MFEPIDFEDIEFSKEKPMRMGIDVHGVIDSDPGIKNALEIGIISGMFEVFVISGPPKDQVKAELEALGYQEGVHYNHLYTIVDYLQSKNVPMWQDEKNTWWASEEDWWSAKAAICEELGLDIMIDNTTHYEPYFKNIKTKFWLYARKDKVN